MYGEKSFGISPGEKITLQMSAGEYLLRMESGKGICPNERETKEINLRPGEERVYRFSISSNANISLTRER